MSTEPVTAPRRVHAEIVRCSNPDCGHEHVRESRGRLALPCGLCHSPMVLVPLVERSERRFGLGEMRGAVLAASTRTHELIEQAATPLGRALPAGRYAAYGEVLEMIDEIAKGLPDPEPRPLTPALQAVVDDLVAEAHS